MRVAFRSLLVGLGIFLATNATQAQGFGGPGSVYLQLGLGLSQHYSNYNDYYGKYRNNYQYGGINVQMEFGIHKYVGLGFGVGAEFGFNGAKYDAIPGVVYYGNPYNYFGVPIYFVGNFHFLQLIADKNGKDFANKLDVYGGVNFGSGPVFLSVRDKYKNGSNNYENKVGALFFFGPHVGIRWYPNEKLGLHAEAGYGKQLINLGVTFKLK